MLTAEVHTPDKSIHDALLIDARRPKLVETLPFWMSRESRVRVGDNFIDLDETRLPRLEGVMGAVHLLRKGQAEFKHEAIAPANTPANKEQSGALLAVKAILEMAGLYGGAQAMKKGRGKNGLLFLGGLGLMAGSGIGLTMDLSGCGPQGIETPPAMVTDIPATAKPVETSTPSLGNEVLTGTPSAAPETPAPVGSVYPSEVSNMTDPKVYSYGGAEGRANMNEYTRALFDRYIAEMGPERGGFLTGATVEELYRSFDSGYDFKLYTTDAGLVWLVQSKSDGSFLVPKNQDGQVFRDLQLSYDYMFQNGTAVSVGTDNFDFQKFSANRVGFVGAWPVLVSVDAQNVPVSWVNMEQGGATAPIVLASATELPEVAVATATPDGRVQITVGSESISVTRDVKYRDGQTSVDIDPLKVQVVGDLLVYTTDAGRLIWNENKAAWTPEFSTSMDYAHPELSPSVPFEAFYDGSKPGDAVYIPSSVALSDALYVSEHPELIADNATYPHYRAALTWSDETVVGYQIVLTGPNQYLLPKDVTTQIDRNTPKPFVYFGMQQTRDRSNNVIYVIKKANWNPTEASPNAVLTTNMGFDKARFEAMIQYDAIFERLSNNVNMSGEIVPNFPYNFGVYRFDNDTFYASRQGKNPNVASLLSTEMLSMFDIAVQQAILDLYNGVGKPVDAATNPGSTLIGSLPDDFTNMIHFSSQKDW